MSMNISNHPLRVGAQLRRQQTNIRFYGVERGKEQMRLRRGGAVEREGGVVTRMR